MAQFKRGQIIRGIFKDDLGNVKHRPAIMVSSAEQIAEGHPLDVVCVTTQLPTDLNDPDFVILKNCGSGGIPHPATGFTEPCAAKISWTRTIVQADAIPGKMLPTVDFAQLAIALGRHAALLKTSLARQQMVARKNRKEQAKKAD